VYIVHFLHWITEIMWPDLRLCGPVKIRVRIDSPHPIVCRKRQLNGGGPSDETGKTEVPCHSRCGTIKFPPCSKAMNIEHTCRPKFCSPSQVKPVSQIQQFHLRLGYDALTACFLVISVGGRTAPLLPQFLFSRRRGAVQGTGKFYLFAKIFWMSAACRKKKRIAK
jgi:hypothetical protein